MMYVIATYSAAAQLVEDANGYEMVHQLAPDVERAVHDAAVLDHFLEVNKQDVDVVVILANCQEQHAFQVAAQEHETEFVIEPDNMTVEDFLQIVV